MFGHLSYKLCTIGQKKVLTIKNTIKFGVKLFIPIKCRLICANFWIKFTIVIKNLCQLTGMIFWGKLSIPLKIPINLYKFLEF